MPRYIHQVTRSPETDRVEEIGWSRSEDGEDLKWRIRRTVAHDIANYDMDYKTAPKYGAEDVEAARIKDMWIVKTVDEPAKLQGNLAHIDEVDPD